MGTGIYLRPVGRLVAGEGGGNGDMQSLPLAGRESLRFSAIELIERQGDWAGRRIVSLQGADDISLRTQMPQAAAHEILYRIQMPRGDIAGLTLDRTRIMGIVNVTPDSFSDGGQFNNAEAAIEHALKLDEEGADILDIGGESTRPGAAPVALEEELRRILPVIDGLRGRTRARLSIDTRKGEVMRRAAAAGVHMINDVSALSYDSKSMRVVADTGLPVLLMHSLGDPKVMQDDPRYDDVLLDVYDALAGRVAACENAGIAKSRIIVDPGVGFGKTLQHNLTLLAGLGVYHGLGTAVALGASRKSFIGALTGAIDPSERVPGSIASAMAGVMSGVQIIRVHDVAETRQALTVFEAALSGAPDAYG